MSPAAAYSAFTHGVLYTCYLQCVGPKKSPPAVCGILTFFQIRLRILNQFFTHLLCVPIYARLQISIQLSPNLTKLCILSVTT